MSGKRIQKKEKKIMGKKKLDTRIKGDGNHRGHGTAGLYEGRGNGPTLVHGDGELCGKDELHGQG